MENNISINLLDLKQENKTIEATLSFTLKDKSINISVSNLLEFYTLLKEWTDSDTLDILTYHDLEITSEDGERWFFVYKDLNEEVDIDEVILEFWKLTVLIEVKVNGEFKIILHEKK